MDQSSASPSYPTLSEVLPLTPAGALCLLWRQTPVLGPICRLRIGQFNWIMELDAVPRFRRQGFGRLKFE